MMIKALLKRIPPLAYVVAILVAIIGWQAFSHNLTKGRLADCQLESVSVRRSLDMAHAEVNDLASHVEHQNERIRAYRDVVSERSDRVRAAEEALERQKEDSRQAILRLAGEAGQSCEEGIALLDEELEL